MQIIPSLLIFIFLKSMKYPINATANPEATLKIILTPTFKTYCQSLYLEILTDGLIGIGHETYFYFKKLNVYMYIIL